jgi:ribosomal protein S18 acetylase RimI-like enzyme
VTDDPVRIRPYQPGDLEALYRVCLLTADDGEDGTALFRDPDLPGHVYVGPYVTFEPDLALVAEDAGGVGGYTLAALDTPSFEERLERDWWPPLRARYPELDPAGYLSTAEKYAIGDISRPWRTAEDLASRFPSHMHIDLVPRMQGRGIGRRLIATMIAALAARGSHGVHLNVAYGNARAAGFYRHLGFAEYPATLVRIFTMNIAKDTAAGLYP